MDRYGPREAHSGQCVRFARAVTFRFSFFNKFNQKNHKGEIYNVFYS